MADRPHIGVLRGTGARTPVHGRASSSRSQGPPRAHVPPPGGPIPPYLGPVVALQNAIATTVEQQSLTIGGQNNPIRIVYGEQILGADVSALLKNGSDLVLRSTWCEGEVEQVERYWVNGADPVSGMVANHYTGAVGQGIDPLLKNAAIAAGLPPYIDTLPGICYSVFEIPAGTTTGFPQITALIKGKKVALTSGGAKTYSQNPAYCIADLIENTVYGMNRAVDWTTVATVAAHCAASIGSPSEVRNLFSLVIDTPQAVDAWLAIMADYAGCWVVPEGAGYRLVLDATGSSVYSFNASNIVAGTWNAQKASAMNTPTVVEVDYTNTTTFPWRTDTTEPVFVPGVYDLVPTVAFRRTHVIKPGLTRYSEAHRYAVQLINGGQLNDLTVQFQAFDIALSLQAGDLIDVTHPSGPSAKLMRLVSATPSSPGRWDITATEHDDGKYSDVVVTGPSSPDTVLDSPLNPPTVKGLTLAELVVINSSGAYVSKLSATWSDASPPGGAYPFVLNYRVDVYQGTTLVETATVQRSGVSGIDPKYITGVLPENILYRVAVTTISTLLAESAPAEKTITNSGKSAPPSDVHAISAYEVAGEVRIQIDPATDLDLTAHEYRYGAPSSTWADAVLLDRVATPSVRYTTRAIPAGDWWIFVKGLDSVRTPTFPWGQESVNAIHCAVTVTSDAGAFLVAAHDFTTATIAGMEAYRDGGGNEYWVTDNGDTWNSVFSGTMSSYTNPIFTYFTDGIHISSFATEHFDVGAVVTGTWTGTVDYDVLTGSATAYTSLSNTDSSYTQYATMNIVQTARWAYLTIIGVGCSLLVTGLGNLKVAVVGRSESGSVTTSASGAVQVNLANRYAKAISIQVTPATGATGRFATYDNVVVGAGVTNHFDAYAFDTAGTKVAVACTYLFTGI